MWLRTEETYRSEEGKNVCCIKQKTAYEMRISDWSSDVCSSDLAVHRRRSADVDRIDPAGIERDVAAESGRLVIGQVVGPSGVARVLPACRYRPVAGVALERAVAACAARAEQGRPGVGHGNVVDRVVAGILAQHGAIGIGGHVAAEPDRDPLRSEEHTSELQSLMRISYAVFCLKKKKETNL